MIVVDEDEYNAWLAIDGLLDDLFALGDPAGDPSAERKALYRLLGMQLETLRRARARARKGI